MQRIVITAVLACALAATVVVVTAWATPNGRRPSGSHGRVITVVEHATTDATTDTGAPGDTAGDLLTWHNEVFDAEDRHQVASDQGSCIRIVPGVSYECAWTTQLRGGQIMVQGPFFDASDSVLAITGGTGRFDGARGHMVLHGIENGTKYVFEFHLR
jgi:allene oxide cyclase